MASKKKKLLTVDQYEQKRGYGSNGLPTVDTYEKRMEERRQEQERQRQERLKQEENKRKKTVFNNIVNSTWQKNEYDPEKERQDRLNNSVLSWVSDIAKKNKENTATQNKLPTQKQEEYKRAANVYEGKADLGSWLSRRTKDVEEALSAKNAKNIRESAGELKQYRYFDKGSDVNLWSPEKREEMRTAQQKTIEEAQKQLDELNRKPANPDVKNFQMRRYDGVQGLELQLTDEDRNKKETLQAQIDYAQKMIQRIDAQNEKDKEYQELINSQQNGDTVWHEENINRQELKNWDTALKAASPDGIKFSDKLERVDGVYAALDPNYVPTGDIVGADYRNAILMNNEERNAFISLYNAGKKAEAWSFYEGLQPYLNQAYSYFESLSMNETARRLPILSSVATEVAHVAQPLEAIMNLPEQIAGALGEENAATDPFSERYIMTRLKNGIRAQVTSDLGDWGWVYQGAMSGVDSFMNIALAQGMGLTNKMLTIAGKQIPALQTATLALFHTQAFETSLQNTMTQGNDSFGYDFIEAWIDAAIETATEIWSVENWLQDPKNLLTYVGKIAISEPSEEVVGAIIEPYVKEMLGHENQYKERAKEIVANGGYFDNAGNLVKVNDMDSATRQAMREWNHDIRMAAQEALISVGPSIGMGSIKIANQNVNIGRELNPYNEEQTTRQIAEAAAQLGEGTDSYKGAEKVQERLDEGKKVSNYRMGQLAQDVLRESQERTVETARQTRTEQIAGYLQENGVSEEEAAGLAETVEKAIEKGGIEKLSKKERQTIHANQAATNALYRFGMTEGKHTDVKTQEALTEEVKNRTQKETEAVKSISDLFNKNTERKLMLREATPDEISEVKGERINNNREVIVYDRKTGEGRFAQIEGIEVKKRNGNWNLRLRVAGQDRTLSASDVKLTNYQTAQVINQATNIPELYSEGYTNLLLDAANEGQFTNENIVDLMRDAKKLRLYAYAGFLSDQVPQTNLPQQLAERIWTQSMTEHYRNRKNQPGEYNRQRTGRAVFGDAVFGTQAWTDAVKDLDEDTVDWMETIAGVAQRAGIDVTFKSMEDNGKTWGWEGKEGIGLNISGRNYVRDLETEKVVETGKHNMMITFGHELTHWLGRNSLQGYNRLEKFVLQNYINDNGYEKFEERINHRMYNMGESLEEAIAEIVADSCDQILLDEQVQQKIAQTDSKLFSEIKGFVKNLVERFKKAIKGDPQTSASQYSKAMAAHINEIRKLWLGAYDEALSGYITDENGKQLTPEEYRKMVAEETGTTAEDISRMSQAELDDAYMDAVENGTVQQQMMFVNEAAERGGYDTEYAYHGTPFFGFTLFDMGRSMNSIFVTYSRELAQIYADNAQVKQISQRAIGNIDNMTDEQLLDVARQYITERAGEKVNSIELNKGKFRISYYDSLDQRNRTMEWDRRTFSQMVQNAVKKTGAMNGVYQLYTRPGRQFVVDAKQEKSNDIKLDGQIAQDMGTDTFNTRMIAKWARENGYDSVRIKNVTGNQGIVTDYGVFFNAQDVKSADPVTYDENGKVIPVSERFNAQEKDIRFSQADFSYDNLINKNDMEVTKLNNISNQEVIAEQNKNGRKFAKDIINEVKERNNGSAYIYNIDTGKNIQVTVEGIRHALQRGLQKEYIQISHQIDSIIKNAVAVNELNPRNNKTNYSTILIGLAETKDNYYAVRLNVSNVTWKTEDYDILYAVNKNEIKKGGSVITTPGLQIKSGSGTTSTISIKNMLDIVKQADNIAGVLSKDVTDKLGIKRPNLKKISNYLRYSQADIDNEYMAAVESLDMAAAQEMVYEAGRRAGYKTRLFHGSDRTGFTVIEPGKGDDGISFFATDSLETANTYAYEKGIKKISEMLPFTEDDLKDEYGYWRSDDGILKYLGKMGIKYSEDGKDLYGSKKYRVPAWDTSYNDGKHTYNLKYSGTISEIAAHLKTAYLGFDNIAQAFGSSANKKTTGVYELLGNTDGFLIVDAQNKSWAQIPFDENTAEDHIIDNEYMFQWDIQKALDLDAEYPTTDTRYLAKWAKQHGYKGVIIENVIDNGGKIKDHIKIKPASVYIFFDPQTQVKSADPVTYDDNGDVIPLSERFNNEKTDIRWSQADVEETRDLIAYHNLGPDQLMAVLRLGGFAMPSIAITRDNYVNDRYGDITVLFRKETIDPKQSRNNKVYGGDAWTPVYPTIEYKIDDNKVASILKKMKEVLPKELSRNNVDLYSDNIESNVNRNNGNIVEAVKDNTNLMAMYLIENGQEIDYPVVEKRLDGFKEFTNDQVVKVAEAIGEDVIREAEEKVGTFNYVQEHPEIVEQVRKALNDNFNETYLNKETDKKMLSMFKDGLYKEGELSSSAISKIFHAAHTYFIRGIEQEIDKYALKDRLREQIDEKDYKAWLKNLFTGVIEKSGIRNNKDKFTYSGSARSWESLHDEETLENVVRIMKAEADKGANTFFNQSAILALGTRDFKSISDIKAHKEQLQHISDEELSAAKTDIVNRFGNIMDDLADTKRESNLFIARDRVLEAIVDAVRVSRTVDGIKRIMSQWQYNISDEQAQEIADLMVEISNLPTEYFEAKPKRAVGLDEIAKVLVPEGVDQELLDALDDQGIAWEFYDGTSEDRLAKMNANDDVKFSKWTESGMDVNYWMEHATPSMVQTEDERELISLYKGKRTSISLSLRRQSEYRSRIRQLEGIVNPSTDVKSEITALKNKLEIEKKKVYRLEEEILQITRNDGWAGMMYQHNMVFRDYVEGKTQEQVRQTVDDMLKLVEQTQEQIAKDTESLKKLATHQAVQTMKSFMGKTSLGRMASILRKTYNSTMNKAEIEDRLAEMALKKASGQDITADTETLAQDLLDKMRGVRTDALESLRGKTFVIGQSLAEELKKENSSIKELQNRIKGSGVKLTTGVKSSTGEIDKHSRISEQWAELREKNGALPDVENMAEIDKLHTIIDFIEGELRASTGAEQFNADFDEVAAMVRASVGNITTYLVDDPKARAQINNLMKQIADLSKATEKTAADMQGLYGQLDEVMKAGERAKSITTVMERDVNEAIEYYNTTARVAAEKERTKVRKALIAQLRSETTEKLLKQQEHYRSMIENQQKARELHQDNEALRRKISTVASRMANRLFAETDQKNVPEETKGLVREVLRMLAENDSVFRRVTNWDKDRIDDAMKRLTRLSNQHGEFVPAKDLDFLVIKAPNEADNDYTLRDKVWQDILDIESGLEAYRKAETATLVNQQAKNDALTKIQEALSEIYSVVRARSEAFIQGKRYEVATLAEQMENEMAASKYKGERTGKIGRAFNTMEKMVGYGNLTPEYFFKNLKNGVMKILHGGFHDAEQRAGLEALRAKLVVQQIAEDTHYDTWDPQEKHQVKLPGGREITMTTEQVMALYATWKRESSQLRPEETAHLLKGGFVLAQGDLSEGIYGRQRNDQRPIRMNEETLEGLRNYLTEDQIRYVVELVNYMSGELAEIGNETSMQQYGIKKFTERYYYPIKAWGGVLNKSSASGIVNKSDARAMRQSFTKNLTANAQNAIEIGDFTPTVMNHIVGMITFNTVGPAVENMNKVLNQQLTYGEAVYDENGEIAEDNRYKRNVRAIFQDAYGVNALKYLERFMDDVNGGMTRQQDKSIQEKLLSVFRKGAVAGSLSVAAQQPLSYIRAAMEINPVYLARALSPTHWGKIHDEMLKYSGIVVIKDMGRFDMNQGQSMIDYITPEEKISKARKAGRTAAEMTTILPEKMDALTWGRMWIACKMEQAALNKGMDTKSDEFMEKVAQRFNEVMRKTQVYDSLMVKSQNMRSTNYAIKAMTSFMAEPTLSLNVLADAVRNFNSKGGKTIMGKALVTFITSAAAQALVKAIMSSGRSPDKKKRLEEQFYIKFMNLFMSEANPLTLVPGYSDIIELLKNGELADDAWSVLGKIKTVWQTGAKWVTGKSDNPYRSFEDTIGQLAQLFTNVPAKNLMRDARAIYNFLNPETYAQREYSPEVVKYGIEANFWNADNIIGVVNSYLKDAGGGFQTTQTAYYNRIYEAERAGNQAEADALKKYLVNTSKAQDPEKTVNDAIRNMYEKDESLTGPEKVQVKLDAGQSVQTIKTWITNNYKAKYIAANTEGRRKLMNELTKMYKLLGISGDDAMKIVTKWVKDEKNK